MIHNKLDNEAWRAFRSQFVSFALDLLPDGSSPIAIQAGHFFLVNDAERAWPAVFSELDPSRIGPERYQTIVDLVGIFPLATWDLGACLADSLRSQGHDAKLFTVVNDWQYLPRGRRGAELRDQFYASHSALLPAYCHILSQYSLDEHSSLSLGRHGYYVSEKWLRKGLAQRLKRHSWSDIPDVDRLRWSVSDDGTPVLLFQDITQVCRLLVCGQTDCAGEVVELIRLLADRHVRRVLNLIPRECMLPVAEGTRRAISLFGLRDICICNASFPCIGARSADAFVNGSIPIDLFTDTGVAADPVEHAVLQMRQTSMHRDSD